MGKEEKLTVRRFQGEHCVSGIDQSYTRTGISITVNRKHKKVSSISFKYIKTKSGKRFKTMEVLEKAINSCLKKFDASDIAIICERIRTFTSSFDIRPDYMKSTGALIACIVDTGYKYGINTYSIDTRAWKRAVLGSSKPQDEPIEGVKNPQKFASVRYIMSLGFDDSLVKIQGRGGRSHIYRDDDAADSACIALSPFRTEPKMFCREY